MYLTDVITLSDIKANLRINSKDTEFDVQLSDIIEDANNEIDKAITPYATDIPIEQDSRLFRDMKYTALMYARARWFREIAQYTRADQNIKVYDQKLESLIRTLKANRTTRTRHIIVSSDPHEDRLPLPMQKGLFIFGDHI